MQLVALNLMRGASKGVLYHYLLLQTIRYPLVDNETSSLFSARKGTRSFADPLRGYGYELRGRSLSTMGTLDKVLTIG